MKEMTCRDWLRANNYEDVADLIDRAMASVAARECKTRRNWWEVLAGGKNGRPRTYESIEFPVLRAAQIHEGVPITPNALCRNNAEEPPAPRLTGRWPRKKRRKKTA